MNNRFIQIHTLTSYPGVLLNRDDAGFAKRLPFGGATRTRVSSQCLKRHWRKHEGEHSLVELGEPQSIRSRRTFELKVLQPLLNEGVARPLATLITEELLAAIVGKADAKQDEEGAVRTNQVTVLGEPEVQFILETARQFAADLAAEVTSQDELSKDEVKAVKEHVKGALDREFKTNLKAIPLAAGLDAAMFGRMVTSDILARGDAAVHVAHAFTVHGEESESDYFSAVDDLVSDDGELGAGHINSNELTSGLFYSYVVIDVPLLVSNIEGCAQSDWESADRTLAGQVVENLIQTIATVSPGAKLGSTAPYAYAQAVLVEAGNAQPRTLANAFQKAVRGRDLLNSTYQALASHLGDLDGMYGRSGERRLAALGPKELLCEPLELTVEPLKAVASWTRTQVAGS